MTSRTARKTTPKHEEDLRFAPADESMSADELEARSRKLAGAVISGGAPRRDRPRTNGKRKPEAA